MPPSPGLARKIKDLTGPGASDDYGIGGTDLGIPRITPDGRMLFVFGDTFELSTVGGTGWRTPTGLYAAPGNLGTGVSWTAAAPGSNGTGSYAGQLVPQPHDTTLRDSFVTTQLPTDLVVIGNTVYMHVMACEGLGNVQFTELYQSTDNGATWQSSGCWWPGNALGGLFQMCTFERADGFVYCMSTGFQRTQGIILQRVPENSFTDPAKWQSWGYSGGSWGWGKPATQILPGAWGEICLRRLPTGRWLFSGFDAGAYAVTVRDLGAFGPTANMFTARTATLVTGAGWGEEDHSRGIAAQLYGGYLIPGSTLADAHFVISQWNTAENWPYQAMQFKANLSGFGGS